MMIIGSFSKVELPQKPLIEVIELTTVGCIFLLIVVPFILMGIIVIALKNGLKDIIGKNC